MITVDRLLVSRAFRVLFINIMGLLGIVGQASGNVAIVGDPTAISIHSITEIPHTEDYGLSFSVTVQDDLGLDNIQSVIVTDLNQNEYSLNDDGISGDPLAHDGTYQWQRTGLATPPNFGTYVFVVTNKQGESTSKIDYIHKTCDVAVVLSPATGQIVTQPDPTFSWNPVANAALYSVSVSDGVQTLWHEDTNSTSIHYNGPNLSDGNFYLWDIRTFDDENNFSRHYDMNFACSGDPVEPVIGIPLVMTGNNFDDENRARGYSLGFFALAADPQGLANIRAVVAISPTGNRYELNDAATDGDVVADDGIYQLWAHGLSNPPETGTYEFSASDFNGHSQAALQQASCIMLAEPSGVSPRSGQVTSDATPTFQWASVTEAASYRIVVSDLSDRELWSQDLPDTSLSVVYNNDNTGTPLIPGQRYKWKIAASDGQYHDSTRYNIIFQYSTADGTDDGGGGGGAGCFILTCGSI